MTLITPEDDPKVRHIRVVQNVAEGHDAVTINTTDSSVAVFYEDQLLVTAITVDVNTVIATLDLQPLGLRFFTTASALIVGNSSLAKNGFDRGRAIHPI